MKNTTAFSIKITLGACLLLAPIAAGSSLVKQYINDLSCMTANLFFEARGEPVQGKVAVAEVTKNRVASKHYPDSICAVVFQRKQFSWTFQHNWKTIEKILIGDIKHLKPEDKKAYNTALQVAGDTLTSYNKILPEDALHYHATYVNPYWTRGMQKFTKIGSHVFYRS